tara:strand:- start:99 stop:425 length:327 start_codon:yes stop_codon:yes gene_type:complete
MFKKFLILTFFLTLSGCGAPAGTAFLGPSVTAARTGSLYQAGASYASSHVIKKTKESLDRIKEAKTAVYQQIDQMHKKIEKDNLNKVVLKNQANHFFEAVKNNLKKYN